MEYVASIGGKVHLPGWVIQGDGMNETSIQQLATRVKALGWSLENIAFGMGGGLLQSVGRDTIRWAQKANAISYEDDASDWQPVKKIVKTDPSKSSNPGRVEGLELV